MHAKDTNPFRRFLPGVMAFSPEKPLHLLVQRRYKGQSSFHSLQPLLVWGHLQPTVIGMLVMKNFLMEEVIDIIIKKASLFRRIPDMLRIARLDRSWQRLLDLI